MSSDNEAKVSREESRVVYENNDLSALPIFCPLAAVASESAEIRPTVCSKDRLAAEAYEPVFCKATSSSCVSTADLSAALLSTSMTLTSSLAS